MASFGLAKIVLYPHINLDVVVLGLARLVKLVFS